MLEPQLQYTGNALVESGEAKLLDKLTSLHEVITVTFGFVDRVAISVYNQDNDELKTFIASSHGEDTLKPTTCQLAQKPALQALVRTGKPAVLDNLNMFTADTRESLTCGMLSAFAESYVMPVFEHKQFYGFVIFNSKQNEVFGHQVLFKMDLFGHMISLMVMQELRSLNVSCNDKEQLAKVSIDSPEAKAHAERMLRYARLIVSSIFQDYKINFDWIEQMCLFQSGGSTEKISMADNLLIKAGCLTEKEYMVMKAYTELGREMIDRLIDNLSYNGLNRVGILANMANFHHTSLIKETGHRDLLVTGIPVEARVVALVDVFDVLSSQCGAGDISRVFEVLANMAVSDLDKDCVAALSACREQIEDIRICYLQHAN